MGEIEDLLEQKRKLINATTALSFRIPGLKRRDDK